MMRIKRSRKLVLNVLLMVTGYLVGRSLVPRRRCVPGLAPRTALQALADTSDRLLVLGVMTSRQNLATRAAAIHATWGTEVAGVIVFYIGSDDNDNDHDTPTHTSTPEPVQTIQGMPVVVLRGVNDTAYPPRDKCFAMLRHMFRAFGSSGSSSPSPFRWFMRVDDDLYVRYERLARYLHSLDHSKPRYIGQPGMGKPTEKGQLGLNPAEPYCMGGTGVLFSAPALRLLVPRLAQCAQNTVTSHEDSELGRCVTKYLGIGCAKSLQTKKLFYQDYTKKIPEGQLTPAMAAALTLHPVKDPRVMYGLHVQFLKPRLQDQQRRVHHLENEVSSMDRLIPVEKESRKSPAQGTPRGQQLTFDRQRTVKDHVVRALSAIQQASKSERRPPGNGASQERSKSGFWSKNNNNNNHEIMLAVTDVLTTNNPVWTYVILENKEYFIEGTGVHNSREHTMRHIAANNILDDDVSDVPKAERQKGLKKKSAARRVRKSAARRVRMRVRASVNQRLVARYQTYSLTHGLQQVLTLREDDHRHRSFLLTSRFQPLQWREADQQRASVLANDKKKKRGDDNDDDGESLGSRGGNSESMDTATKKDSSQEVSEGPPSSFSSSSTEFMSEESPWPSLHVLLPLYGRHKTYLTFLDSVSSAAALYPARVTLRVSLFHDAQQEYRMTLEASRRQNSDNSSAAPNFHVSVVEVTDGAFSRARALNLLVPGLGDGDVLVVLDVDMVLTSGSLFRAARIVHPGTAYFPIVFSRFSPSTVCYGRDSCNVNLLDFSDHVGLWRLFGFGMVALTAGDLRRAGTYNDGIIGWGKEDADFLDRCMAHGIKIFRAPDVGLIHQFHNQSCDHKLPAEQLSMCIHSRNAVMGSSSKMTQILMDLGI